MLPLLCSLLFPAAAATDEISLDVGWLGTADPAFDIFGGGTLTSVGLRGGIRVHPNVELVLGWQHAANGGEVGLGAADAGYDDDEYVSGGSFSAALLTDQVSVGSKADVKVWSWLHPYVTVQLVGMRGIGRLDDDANDDENLTQVQRVGFTGGAMGALGLDFPIHVKGRVGIAPYLEMGYGWLAPLRLHELGDVQFAGFTGNTGVGVRF
jgi:hypothetical protein